MTTPEPLSDAQITDLVKHAAKCSAAIYIAADKVVADDISETLRNLVVALNQSRRSPERKDVIEACASFLDLTAQQIRLIAGELSAQEMRAVRAMLENRAKIIRALKEQP